MKREAHEIQHGLSIMDEVAKKVLSWSDKEFGDARDIDDREKLLLSAVAKVGHLNHAVLKMQQKIRGSKEQHLNDMRNALGDICILLADYCDRSGFSMRNAYAESLIKPLDAQLNGSLHTNIDRERWLRRMSALLSACITNTFFAVKVNTLSYVAKVLRICESISYEVYGQPIWKVMSSVVRGAEEFAAGKSILPNDLEPAASEAPAPKNAEPKTERKFTYTDVKNILCEACRLGIPTGIANGSLNWVHFINGDTVKCHASLWRDMHTSL
jgi:hypothetical protein